MEHTNIRYYPVTKKQLCHALGIVSPRGKCYYHMLRRDYLTPTLQKEIGINFDAYRNKSLFPIHIAKKILQALDLQPSEVWPQKPL